MAFGLGPGQAADHFMVSVAALGLLRRVANERPLVCLIDDAQLLGLASAQALAFVARHLLAERVAMVFSVREPSKYEELTGSPELVVTALSDADASALPGSVVPGRLDQRMRDRIVAETRGNPLALLELPRGLTAAELAGGFGRREVSPLVSRIEHSFRRQLERPTTETQQLLLIATAEPVGDTALLWRAAAHLGITAAAQAKFAAAAPEAVNELLTTAERGPLDGLRRARLARLRTQLEFARRRGSDAPPFLLEAAHKFQVLDHSLARETCLEALGAAIFAGRLGHGLNLREQLKPHERHRRHLSLHGLPTCSWYSDKGAPVRPPSGPGLGVALCTGRCENGPLGTMAMRDCRSEHKRRSQLRAPARTSG